MSEEEEIGAARAELRKQLLLDLTSRDLKHAVLAYLNRLPKKSVSKEHLIADLLVAIAQSGPFLEQKRFIERLIEDVPLELLGVTELATLRLVGNLPVRSGAHARSLHVQQHQNSAGTGFEDVSVCTIGRGEDVSTVTLLG